MLNLNKNRLVLPMLQIIIILIINIPLFSFEDIKITNEEIVHLKIETFENYTNLDQVKKLELYNCSIVEINEDAFKNFTKLEALILTNNTFRDANFKVESLKYLDLSNNSLWKAPNLENFPNLINLNLSYNSILTIDYNVEEHRLKNLDLLENPLREVNVRLSFLENITMLTNRYSETKLNFDCPSLKSFKISNVKIESGILDNICSNNNATIYISILTSFYETHECSITTKTDRVSTEKKTLKSKIMVREKQEASKSKNLKKIPLKSDLETKSLNNNSENNDNEDISVDNISKNTDEKSLLLLIGIAVVTIFVFTILLISAITMCILFKSRRKRSDSSNFDYQHLTADSMINLPSFD